MKTWKSMPDGPRAIALLAGLVAAAAVPHTSVGRIPASGVKRLF